MNHFDWIDKLSREAGDGRVGGTRGGYRFTVSPNVIPSFPLLPPPVCSDAEIKEVVNRLKDWFKVLRENNGDQGERAKIQRPERSRKQPPVPRPPSRRPASGTRAFIHVSYAASLTYLLT